MKIKVTYEKIFDSEVEFDKDYDASYQEFENIICEYIVDWIDFSDGDWKIEKLEDDSK